MKHKLLATSLIILALATATVNATTLYWSGNGTTLGGGGTWNTTLVHWGASMSGPFTSTWNNANTDDAILSAGTGSTGGGTVVLNSPITMNGTFEWDQTPGTYASYSVAGASIMTFSAGSQIKCLNSVGGSIGVGTFSCPYAGTITKTGTAQVEFNNANGAVAKWILKEGIASFAAGNRLGINASPPSDFLTFDGGTYRANTTYTYTMTNRKITITGNGGTILMASSQTAMYVDQVITSTGNGTLTINTGSFVPMNTGNNFAGNLALAATTTYLRLGASDVIPDTAVVSLVSGAIFDLSGYVKTVTINTGGAGYTATPTITFNNTGTGGSGASAAAVLTSGVVTTINVTALGSGYTSAPTVSFSASGSTTAATATPVIVAGSFNETVKSVSGSAGTITLGTGTLTLANPAGESFGGIIGGASGKIVLNGGTYWTASGANTYTGGTTINSGRLRVGNASALGTGKLTFAGGALSSSGTTAYTLSVPVDVTGNVTMGDASNTGALTFQTGAWAFKGGDRQLTISSAVTINSAIGNDGSARALTKAGSSTLTLGGANTYGGVTTVSAGTLEGKVASSIPAGVTVGSSGTLKLSSATAMASGANLTLAASPSASTVNLNFTGTQTINTLSYGATSKAQGTWGSTTSTAQHKDSVFTSNGLLQVTTNPGGGATTIALSPIADVCLGSPSSLSATVTGSSPTGDVEFFDGATSLGTAPLVSGTAAKSVTLSLGTHANITVTYLGDDLNNQSTSDAQSATVLGLPDSTITAATGVCANSSGNTASVPDPSPGDRTFAWTISGGTIDGSTTASTVSYTAGASGSVQLGCTVTFTATSCSSVGSKSVTIYALPVADAGADKTVCFGCGTTLGGSPTGSGGTGPYTYNWTPITALSDATAANPTASPTSTTIYTVTVTDAHGCISAGDSVTVTVNNVAPAISSQPANSTVCSGSTATFSVVASGSSLGYSWAKIDNGGWGSGNLWSVTGNGSTWLGSSTQNDQGNPDCTSFSANGDINSSGGNALGMWGGNDGTEAATRTFPALAAGQVVSIDFDNGNVDNDSKVGFSLQTAGGAADVLQFYFKGGQATYRYWDDVTGEQDTGIGWGYTGFRVQFALTCANAYVLTVTPCGGAPVTLTGTYSGTIAQVKLFNRNTAGGDPDNVYFNNFLIGGYIDNADNYSTVWAGENKGNQPIASGNGGTSYTTDALSTGDGGAQYAVVVYGCGGAVLSSVASVTVNANPTVTVNSPTVCASALPATITATPAGGTSPYSYAWAVPAGQTPPGNVASFDATVAGLYSVVVTDANGCSGSGSGTLTVNPNPTVTVNSPTVCASTLPATITATPAIGTGPYNYVWTVPVGEADPGNVASFSTSTAGLYSVVVTDANGCSSVPGSGTLTVNPNPTVTVNSATVCASTLPAPITATPAGGTGPYNYAWTVPVGQTPPGNVASFGATVAGNYSVVVTDANGCTGSGAGTLTVNLNPTVAVNSPTVCATALPATVTATPAGGTGPYNYAWTVPVGEANPGNVASFSASTAGNYSAVVTDANGCTGAGAGALTVVPQPVLTIDTTNQVACAGSQVTWSVAATGTSLTYQWQRDGTNLLEGVENFTGTTTATLTNSAVAAQDAVDAAYGYACTISSTPCTAVTSTLAALALNTPPTVSVNSETACASALPATITATPAGGTAPYSYAWTVPAGATDPGNVAGFSATVAGTYSVMVTDANGCSGSGSGTLTVNPNPTVAVNSPTVCASTLPATITATPASGTAPYSYAWTVPVGEANPGNVASFGATVAGLYSVVVTDANGCTGSGAGTLAVNPNPTVAVNSPTVCASTLPATITATPAGGTGPYNYAWTVPSGEANPGNVASFGATVAGLYSVVVTDANGCTGSGAGTLAVNPNPTVAVNSPTVCASTLPATITATPAGGTGPYNYAWTVPVGEANPGNVASFGATVAGNYSVVVTDANGCTGAGAGTLTVNANPTAAVNSPTVCASTLPATITATPAGGTGPYSYAWTVPVGEANPGNVASFGATVAGNYSVVVTDANGCTGAGAGTLTVNPNPTVAVNSPTVCASTLPATITATPAGGTGPYSYVWTVPTGATDPGNVAGFGATVAGTYSVVVSDANGCTGTGAGTLTVNANPTVAVNSPTVCASALPATITATPAGGTGPYNYAWTVPTGGTDPGNVASFSATVAGAYSVVVSDANGCTGTGAGTLTVNANPTVAVNSPTVCSSALPATITATPAGGTGPYSYAWTVPVGEADPGNVASFGASTAGGYSVVLTDANGCTGSGSGTLTVNVCKDSVTITSIVDNGNGTITINFTGGAGASFTLMKTSDLSITRDSWTAVSPDQPSTPGSFTITPVSGEFYTVRSN